MHQGWRLRSRSGAVSAVLLLGLGLATGTHAALVRVPQDFAGIQAAIDAAPSGDTVLVARGTHTGGLVITGKKITLASAYILTGDTTDIAQTVIDGGSPILTIDASVGYGTTVRGLTLRNGSYQIINNARGVNILDDRFINGGGDELSFESAGGLVQGCLFDHAGDDGIDSDHASDPTIVNNTFRNAGDDGIEVRLHSYTGPMLEIVIRGNVITGCAEDGIQLIDYAGASSRRFRIEGNVLASNAMVGLACMANGETNETFAGAPLVERVEVINNTFSGNPYALTGGDNMLVMNNIFRGATQVGVKRVAATSLVTYNDFWSNGTDFTGSIVDVRTTLLQNPLLDANYGLQPGSPCVDAGAASVVWNGSTVTAPAYTGAAPDLGARESQVPVAVDGIPSSDPVLLAPRPNPARGEFTVTFTLAEASAARLEVLDLAGRRILSRDLGALGAGPHMVPVPEGASLAAGVYLLRLDAGGRTRTVRFVALR